MSLQWSYAPQIILLLKYIATSSFFQIHLYDLCGYSIIRIQISCMYP